MEKEIIKALELNSNSKKEFFEERKREDFNLRSKKTNELLTEVDDPEKYLSMPKKPEESLENEPTCCRCGLLTLKSKRRIGGSPACEKCYRKYLSEKKVSDSNRIYSTSTPIATPEDTPVKGDEKKNEIVSEVVAEEEKQSEKAEKEEKTEKPEKSQKDNSVEKNQNEKIVEKVEKLPRGRPKLKKPVEENIEMEPLIETEEQEIPQQESTKKI